MEKCIDKYWRLVEDLEKEMVRVALFHRKVIGCKPGCDECCKAFTVFPVEAQVLQNALEHQKGIGVDPEENEAIQCSLLKNKRCLVYKSRPFICRTQGLPIGYADHEQGTVEVSACEHNFGEYDQFEIDRILMMDAFNSRLRDINIEFCKAKGIDALCRVPITEVVETFRDKK